MMHPIVAQAYAREIQRDMLREADRRRMMRLAQAGRPGLAERVIGRMSSLLAAARGRLQKQRVSPRIPQTGRPLEGLK